MNKETLINIKNEIKFACCRCEIDEQILKQGLDYIINNSLANDLKQASNFIIKAINHRLDTLADRGEISVDVRGSALALFEHYMNEDPNFLIKIIKDMKAKEDELKKSNKKRRKNEKLRNN
ncbi:hypothetical protein [Campylobacter helveticus]|uniref:hypothetical protein n=1 Tax=Campylobacter helveticus TaxID=28898 RepID=UPI00111193E8|nr:hypothetical protein [Campylobacter helveticus]TNB60915.1 hypothetical protein FDW43_09550 [Campylobacter helveticus]TNH36290.1 hypothetical protein FDW45_05930 [Campylobacter helveticus]